MSHALHGHQRWTGHSEAFWQNVVHWKRECKTLQHSCLEKEPYEQYEKWGWALRPGVQYATGEEQRAVPRKNWEGNSQEGQGSPNGGNRLQVSGIFYPSQVAGGNKLQVLRFFLPSVYKLKQRFLLKFCVAMMAPGST